MTWEPLHPQLPLEYRGAAELWNAAAFGSIPTAITGLAAVNSLLRLDPNEVDGEYNKDVATFLRTWADALDPPAVPPQSNVQFDENTPLKQKFDDLNRTYREP